MDELTIWTWLLLLTQLFFYVSCASIIAASFLLLFSKTLITVSEEKFTPTDFQLFLIKYGQRMLLAGFLSITFNFLLSVGDFAEFGFMGMFDIVMLSIIWESSLGVVASYRVLAFFVLFFCFLWTAKFYDHLNNINYKKYVIAIFAVSAFYLLARSFSSAGHSVELPLFLQYVLSLHVFLVMLWIGSLYPLYRACYRLPNQQLYQLMHGFGNYAVWVVGILLVSGLTVLYFLSHAIEEFFTTIYGQWFIAKLVGVSLVLLFALHHKIYLVPNLLHKRNTNFQLAASIKVEAILIMVVLLFTYIVSHLVGPEHLSH